MKYFTQCKNIADLKAAFRAYVKQYHPDVCKEENATEIMKSIIAEYEALKESLPWEKSNDNNATSNMTKEEFTAYVSKEMKEIISSISHLPLKIEVIGSWLWVSGNTKPYKAYLTAFNFRWCPKKKMYSWHMGEYRKHGGKTKDIEDIRQTYGSVNVRNTYRPELNR